MNELITNGGEIRQRILFEIQSASSNIFLAMAYFTDRDIALSVIGAKDRGVNVDVILSSNAQNESVKLMFKGADVKVHAFDTGDERGMMHHKFCLIDNKISINGSYNYSVNASTNSVENVTVSDDIQIYSQFLKEFERLKYNIDHNIGVNITNVSADRDLPKVENPVTMMEGFTHQLNALVFSATDMDTNIYKSRGYQISKDSYGSLDIYQTEFNRLKDEIRPMATDEGLGSKKSNLIGLITNAFESTKSSIETERDERIFMENRKIELETKQVSGLLTEVKEAKSKLELGNNSDGEKGLIDINKEIEKNRLNKKSLESTLLVEKFWNTGTGLVVGLLVILTFYLSLFFASALYKIFFESNDIQKQAKLGNEVELPQLVDANAILKIFSDQGVLFGLMAMLFFLIPVLMSNLKLLGGKIKWVNYSFMLLGLIVFDIIVAGVVALNIDKITSFILGQESSLKFYEVIYHGEFWMMFMFGMFPLIITHYAIDSVHESYKKSQRYIVDAMKDQQLKVLDAELIDLEAIKVLISAKVLQKEEQIDKFGAELRDLELKMNGNTNSVSHKYNELIKEVTILYEKYKAQVLSGLIFTNLIFDTVVSAFRSGFIEFLPVFYSADEVAIRVRQIEETERNNALRIAV